MTGLSSAFTDIDAIARQALSDESWFRYTSCRDVLLAEGKPIDSIIATLSILVWELSRESWTRNNPVAASRALAQRAF